MAVRAVAYPSCRIWEIRETSSVPGGYTCEKCTELPLLTDCVTELELELDSLRIIRGSENIIDKSYSEVVTPKVQAACSWVITRRVKGGMQIVQGSPVAILLNNRYTTLDTVGGDGLSGASSSSQVSGTVTDPEARRERVQSDRAILMGDSIVRGTDRRFCGRRRDTRMVHCLLVARVKDVSEQLQNILTGKGEQPDVIVHIGTNDIGRQRDGVLRNEYREL
eukprot:g23167.t1